MMEMFTPICFNCTVSEVHFPSTAQLQRKFVVVAFGLDWSVQPLIVCGGSYNFGLLLPPIMDDLTQQEKQQVPFFFLCDKNDQYFLGPVLFDWGT